MVLVAAQTSVVGAMVSLSQASQRFGRSTGGGAGMQAARAARARDRGAVEAARATAALIQAQRATLQSGAQAGVGGDCTRDADGLRLAGVTIALSPLANGVCAIQALAQARYLAEDLGDFRSVFLT